MKSAPVASKPVEVEEQASPEPAPAVAPLVPTPDEVLARKDRWIAIAALALGAVALTVSLFFSYLIGGLVGFVAASLGWTLAKTMTGGPKAMALIGAIFGGIAVAGMVIVNWFID